MEISFTVYVAQGYVMALQIMRSGTPDTFIEQGNRLKGMNIQPLTGEQIAKHAFVRADIQGNPAIRCQLLLCLQFRLTRAQGTAAKIRPIKRGRQRVVFNFVAQANL